MVKGPPSISGVLEKWLRQGELLLAPPAARPWRGGGGILEDLIILFVNNHLLLSDLGPEKQGTV